METRKYFSEDPSIIEFRTGSQEDRTFRERKLLEARALLGAYFPFLVPNEPTRLLIKPVMYRFPTVSSN